MTAHPLKPIAEQMVRLATRQGFIIEREVRDALSRAGLDESRWREVLDLTEPVLSYRRGRYYPPAPTTERTAGPGESKAIVEVVEQLVAQHRHEVERVERREQGRVELVHPVQVVTEDQRTYTLLTRDLSSSGIRLIGTRRLLGQKIRVRFPLRDRAVEFTVRILWTCPVGEDLVENGGTFLDVAECDAITSMP